MSAGQMTRPYALVRPCPKCPFRTDVPAYLTEDRVRGIAEDVERGAEFYCHETTVPVEDDEEGTVDMTSGPGTKVCAGSLILMEKMGRPNQMARIAERIGVYDPSRLDMDAPVHNSWVEMQRHFRPALDDDEQEQETCGIVGPECEAPAGYAVGGGVIEGTEYVDDECSVCGTPVCTAEGCSTNDPDGNIICVYCEEE